MRNVGVLAVWMTSSQKYMASSLLRNIFEVAVAAQERF